MLVGWALGGFESVAYRSAVAAKSDKMNVPLSVVRSRSVVFFTAGRTDALAKLQIGRRTMLKNATMNFIMFD